MSDDFISDIEAIEQAAAAKPRKAAAKPKKKAAKAKAAKPKTAKAAPEADADGGEAKPAKAARKTKAPKAPKEPVIAVTTTMHGETRLNHRDADGAAALAAIAPLIDGVHGLGRVRITSATHGDGGTMLHAVLPDHPADRETRPGLILAIDADGTAWFDHVEIGHADAALIDRAAWSILNAMRADDGTPADAVGRHPEWFVRSVEAAEAAGALHAGA